MKKKTILVCGATGFLGKNLILSFLKNKNYKIIAVYNKKKPYFNSRKIVWKKADLRLYKDCLNVTKKVDIILQFAATTSGSKDIINEPFLHVTDNAVMNSYLLRASYVNKVKHFIFPSCTVIYKNSNTPLNENQVNEKKIFPNYFGVGHTKLYIEKMCKFYSNISDTKFSIIRHSNIFGPYDKFDLKKGHFIGSSIKKVFNTNDKYIKIFGDGSEKRDVLYIDDFISFLKNLLKYQNKNYEIFNCSYGKSFRIIDLLKKIIKISKKNLKIIKLKNHKSIKVNISVNSSKAKRELGWHRKFSVDSGLKKSISWFLKNEKIL